MTELCRFQRRMDFDTRKEIVHLNNVNGTRAFNEVHLQALPGYKA
jgi:hypothetical protein